MSREPEAVDSATLTRRIAAGDEAAFTAFYSQWFDATFAFARAASRRDESFCLDVVQDVMMTAAKKLPPLSSDASVATWMTRTVFHAVTDRVRSEQRRRRREELASGGRDGAQEFEPWHGMVDDERRRWLAACIGELSVDDQALLTARFGDSTTVAAAGAAVGLGPDAAHGRLRRTIERLRQKAAEWWHGA